jgi:hypothetical protein
MKGYVEQSRGTHESRLMKASSKGNSVSACPYAVARETARMNPARLWLASPAPLSLIMLKPNWALL